MEQETLIYIDDKQKYDASVAANSFTNNDVRNRVYINTLGAELGIKYLNSENIDTSYLKNIHSIKKIIEEFDIADIILKNIHIDVRVVFDENAIFIPKSHFEYGLLPDIYLILKLEKDHSNVKFLGFFEPKLINKNNTNDKYYFIEKEKLSSALDLAQYIESNKAKKDYDLPIEDVDKFEDLIISMADNDISENDKKYLLEQLIKSSELRDKFIEYENFETLSYKAMRDPSIDKHNIAQDITPVDEFDAFEEKQTAEEADIESLDTLFDNQNDNSDDVEALETVDENADSEIISAEDTDTKVEPLDDDNNDSISDIDAIAAETVASVGIEAIADGAESVAEDVESVVDDVESVVDDVESVAEDVESVVDGVESVAEDVESVADDIIDTTAMNAKEIVENASDKAENLVDMASDSAEDIISDISETNHIEKFDLPSEDEISENNFDISELRGNVLEDAVTLEEIKAQVETLQNNKLPEDAISLESIETHNIDEENDISIDLDNASSYMDTFPEEKLNSNIEDSISLEDIDDSGIGSEEDVLSAYGIEQEKEGKEDLIIDDEPSSDSFGKNLLENLNIDENTDILIENSDYAQQNDISEQTEADDILTQIDDVIDTATISDFPVVPDDQNITNTNSTDILDTSSAETNIDDTLLTEDETTNDADMESNDIITDVSLPLEETIDNNIEKQEDISIESLDSVETLDTTDLSSEDNTLSDQIDENEVSDFTDHVDELLQDIEEPKQEQEEVQEEIQKEVQEDDQEEIQEDVQEDVQGDVQGDLQEDTLTEISALTDSAPQDFIEDLLDNETTASDAEEELSEGDDLNAIYNESESISEETQKSDNIEELEEIAVDSDQPEAQITVKTKQQAKGKILILAAVVVGLIAAASAFYFIKPKDNNSADYEPLPNNSASTVAEEDKPVMPDASKGDKPVNAEKQTTEKVLENNAPEIKKSKEVKKQVIKELKNNPPKKVITSTAYMSVSKLVWDVPDNVSESVRMQSYLRTTGKSIKLTLSTDLLLASEYAYANSVKVGITIGGDGSVKSLNILSSSGSSQIDNIVLQSVKETLNAIKPPSEDVKGNELNLSLIIYF